MSISKTSIKEANEHLKELHQRLYDTETQLQLHTLHIEELQKNNKELQQMLAKENEEKNELERVVKSKEELIERLLSSAEEKDTMIAKLEEKSRLFHELIEHRSAMEHIVKVLNEVSMSCDQSRDRDTPTFTDTESTDSTQLMSSTTTT